ncbi:MAG: AMP-binding protein [Acetobacteraceae bacterium]
MTHGATMAADPDTSDRRMPSAQAWQQAERWSQAYDTDAHLGRLPLDAAFISRPLTESWHLTARQRPDHLAVADAGRVLSYAEFLDLVGRLGAAIAGQPAPPGPLALLLPDSVLYAAALYAGLVAGRAVLMLDDGNPPERNARILSQAGTGLVVIAVGDTTARHIAHGRATLEIGDIASLPPPITGCRVGMDDLAFIATTSGSTGHPKLVGYSQRAIAHRACQFGDSLGLTGEDRMITGSGATGSYPVLGYLSASLRVGASSHLLTLRTAGIHGLFERMRDHRITALRAPPSMLRVLGSLDGAREAFAGIRLLRLGSEQPTWDDVAMIRRLVPPGCRITNSYGSTECGSFNFVAGDAASDDPIRMPAGVPHAAMDAVVVDDEGNPCGPGEVGELVVRSRYAALGEFRDGALVAGRMIPDAADPAARIYFTGDLARQTRAGIFVVLGRKDRMLKINGYRVEPTEVEAAIRLSPDVAETVVLPHATGDSTMLVAFVARRHGAGEGDAIDAALRVRLKASLPAYMVPSRIIVLDALPRLAGGKVDGQALLAMLR